MAKKKRNFIEDDHCEWLCDWWRGACRSYAFKGRTLEERDLYHIKNGGQHAAEYRYNKATGKTDRYSLEGARFKKMGVRPHKLDFAIDIAAGGFHGFKLEMKAPGQKPRPGQVEEMNELVRRGYCAVWADHWELGKEAIESYLKDLKVRGR